MQDCMTCTQTMKPDGTCGICQPFIYRGDYQKNLKQQKEIEFNIYKSEKLLRGLADIYNWSKNAHIEVIEAIGGYEVYFTMMRKARIAKQSEEIKRSLGIS